MGLSGSGVREATKIKFKFLSSQEEGVGEVLQSDAEFSQTEFCKLRFTSMNNSVLLGDLDEIWRKDVRKKGTGRP